MSNWELAQLNIAHLVAPIDSPTLTDFVAELDRINALAENSPGFIWRLESAEGNATNVDHPFGDTVIVNLSVWDSVPSLRDYVYKSAHTDIMKHRKQWFARANEAYQVLWWVPAGHRPNTFEAQQKLKLLQLQGPCSDAFTFKHAYPHP
jgi:hypothetical protein